MDNPYLDSQGKVVFFSSCFLCSVWHVWLLDRASSFPISEKRRRRRRRGKRVVPKMRRHQYLANLDWEVREDYAHSCAEVAVSM